MTTTGDATSWLGYDLAIRMVITSRYPRSTHSPGEE